MLEMCRIACQCSQTATRYVLKREWAGSVSPVMWKPVVLESSVWIVWSSAIATRNTTRLTVCFCLVVVVVYWYFHFKHVFSSFSSCKPHAHHFSFLFDVDLFLFLSHGRMAEVYTSYSEFLCGPLLWLWINSPFSSNLSWSYLSLRTCTLKLG